MGRFFHFSVCTTTNYGIQLIVFYFWAPGSWKLIVDETRTATTTRCWSCWTWWVGMVYGGIPWTILFFEDINCLCIIIEWIRSIYLGWWSMMISNVWGNTFIKVVKCGFAIRSNRHPTISCVSSNSIVGEVSKFLFRTLLLDHVLSKCVNVLPESLAALVEITLLLIEM